MYICIYDMEETGLCIIGIKCINFVPLKITRKQ